MPDTRFNPHQGRQHQAERLGACGKAQRDGGEWTPSVPRLYDGRQQQAIASAIPVALYALLLITSGHQA